MKTFALVGLIDPQQGWAIIAYGLWLVGVSLLATGLGGLSYVRFWMHIEAANEGARGGSRSRFSIVAAEKFGRLALQAWPVAVLGLVGRLFTSAAPLRPLGEDPTILDSVGRASTGRVLGLLGLLCVVAGLIRTELDEKRRTEQSIRPVLAGLTMLVLLLVDIGTSVAPFRVALGVVVVCVLAILPVRRVLEDAPDFFESEDRVSSAGLTDTATGQGLALQPIGRRESRITGTAVVLSLVIAFGFGNSAVSPIAAGSSSSGAELALTAPTSETPQTELGNTASNPETPGPSAAREASAPTPSSIEPSSEAGTAAPDNVATETTVGPTVAAPADIPVVEPAPPIRADVTPAQDTTTSRPAGPVTTTESTSSEGQGTSSDLPDPEGQALTNDAITAKCQRNVAVQVCYQRATIAMLKTNGIKKMLDQTAELIAKDPEAAKICHDTLHKVGREALKMMKGDLAKVTAEGNFICSTGFFHGAIEERLALFSMAQLPKELPTICVVDEKDPASYPTNSCIHGLGHGLLIKTNDLFKALKLCDALEPLNANNRPDYRDWCAQGAFMQNSINLGEPAAKAEFDLKNPLYPCDKTPEHQQAGCYRQQASHYMAAFRVDDFEQVAKTVCEKSPAKYARDCYAGLGSSMGPNRPPDVIVRTCTETPAAPESREYCIASAASQLILFTGKRERSDELCAAAKEPLKAFCVKATEDNWKRVSSATTYAVAKKTGEV